MLKNLYSETQNKINIQEDNASRLQNNLVNLNSPKTRSNCIFRSAKFSDKFNSATQILSVSTCYLLALGSSEQEGSYNRNKLKSRDETSPDKTLFLFDCFGFPSQRFVSDWLKESDATFLTNQR